MVRRWILFGLSLSVLLFTLSACSEEKKPAKPSSDPVPKADPSDAPKPAGAKPG